MFLSNWAPPVGVFIGLLGLLGIIVPLVRDVATMRRIEKSIWTFVMFALLWLEIRSIYVDRDKHDQEQAAARAEQLREFNGIANKIDTTIREGESQFQATMSRSEALLGSISQVMGVSRQALAGVTGGHSYCFITMGPRNIDNIPSSVPVLKEQGTHVMFDLAVSIIDTDEQERAAGLGETQLHQKSSGYIPILMPSGLVLDALDFPEKDTSSYRRFRIFMWARNGAFTEFLRRQRTAKGQWVEALVVTAHFYDSTKAGRVLKAVDSRFDGTVLQNDVDWQNSIRMPELK